MDVNIGTPQKPPGADYYYIKGVSGNTNWWWVYVSEIEDKH